MKKGFFEKTETLFFNRMHSVPSSFSSLVILNSFQDLYNILCIRFRNKACPELVSGFGMTGGLNEYKVFKEQSPL